MASRDLMLGALNRLAKWRQVFAGWHLGSTSGGEPGVQAMLDLREAVLLLRAELNAMTAVLIAKRAFSEEEWTAALTSEAVQLDKDLEKRFPGFRANDMGIAMDSRAADTMKRLGFPE